MRGKRVTAVGPGRFNGPWGGVEGGFCGLVEAGELGRRCGERLFAVSALLALFFSSELLREMSQRKRSKGSGLSQVKGCLLAISAFFLPFPT